jgi:hypothetical protein
MATTLSAGAKSGGCLCGAVRFTAVPGKQHEFGVCHCSMCRKWAAGPFFAVECGDTVKIEDPSKLGTYKSSEWAERSFCKQCGSVLFYRLVAMNYYVVSAEAFDNTAGFVLTSQVFIDEKPAYYDFANKTVTMTGAEVFALFAPPDQAQDQSQGKD